jgi:hypothetical protein
MTIDEAWNHEFIPKVRLLTANARHLGGSDYTLNQRGQMFTAWSTVQSFDECKIRH